MSLEKKIEEKLNLSLKNKDKNVFPTLRLIISAIKDEKISLKVRDDSLKDNIVINILKKMIKQRKDSCDAYEKAGRNDLLTKEKNEIEIINKFLPKQLSDEEMLVACKKSIKELGATSMKDMGKVIGDLKKKYSDVLDFSKVSKAIKELLN